MTPLLAQETYTQTDIVGPSGSQQFGATVTVLTNGNFVVTDPLYDGAAADVGSVSLYDGETLQLISRLTGSTIFDRIGNGIFPLPNGNFVVTSADWDNGAQVNAGAATWIHGTLGLTGTVSASNSLVGATASGAVGLGGVKVLTNGNYIVRSHQWDDVGKPDAGAVTWANGNTGITGTVSAANSLVGASAQDYVGINGVFPLANDNYVVASSLWNNGAAADAGAVTLGNGATGTSGVVGTGNSLYGVAAGDQIGSQVVPLPNGNFVTQSSNFSAGINSSVGAVTWVSGVTGLVGPVTAANSLVGSTAFDQIGLWGIELLANNSYIVRSPLWDNTGAPDAGAVTWGSGTGPITGVVSSANSLVGTQISDLVGFAGPMPGVVVLRNGNYVVVSSSWNGSRGAVTFGNGTTGTSGPVSSSNSLVGSAAGDAVGSGGVTPLRGNHNYVVVSVNWSGTGASAGAVTWGSGTSGVSGVVSITNSLVGGQNNDRLGWAGIVPLTNGNYVIRNSRWAPSGEFNVGAVTWANGAAPITGHVSASNSIVGSTSGDIVGEAGILALTNGNFVVISPLWTNGAFTYAGAVTWGNGAGGTFGAISSANSLVGSLASEMLGSAQVVALTNGNYVVTHPTWANGANTNAGAAIWGNGAGGTFGPVTTSNALFGGAGDRVGFNGVTALANGNYVVVSSEWSAGNLDKFGAVTWGNGAAGIFGAVSAANSLVGSTYLDEAGLGGVVPLTNGDYVVGSPYWDGAAANVGAITRGNGATGSSGPVSAANSTVGTVTGDSLGDFGVAPLTVLPNGHFAALMPLFDGANTNSGAVVWGRSSGAPVGPVTTPLSVLGIASTFGNTLQPVHDAPWDTLLVARRNDNRVTAIVPSLPLTVTLGGNAAGVVTSQPPAVNCGGACNAAIRANSVVTLTATPAISSTLVQWTGDCAGSGVCVILMSQARSVTAHFGLKTFALNASVAGSGAGNIGGLPANPGAIPYGTQVNLTAAAQSNSTFAGWSGDCAGTGVCNLVMTQARTVVATFALKTYALTVTKSGSGDGTVAGIPANPGAIDHGTVVSLTATPDAASLFAGWSGACSGMGVCVVSMTQARAVTATFDAAFPVTLPNPSPGGTVEAEEVVAASGEGLFAVQIIVAGVAPAPEEAQATQLYPTGTVLQLTAVPNPAWVFVAWGGDLSGAQNPQQITVNGPMTITATFAPMDIYLPAVRK